MEIDAAVLTKVKDLELRGVQAAESGDLKQAIVYFDQAIDLIPERASGYNNRAQALRLLGQNEGAMQDLDRAINLKETGGSSGRVNALCQRALLHRVNGDEAKSLADLEEAASAGHEFARRALVHLNPYSALCNQMLHQMLQKLNEIK